MTNNITLVSSQIPTTRTSKACMKIVYLPSVAKNIYIYKYIICTMLNPMQEVPSVEQDGPCAVSYPSFLVESSLLMTIPGL